MCVPGLPFFVVFVCLCDWYVCSIVRLFTSVCVPDCITFVMPYLVLHYKDIPNPGKEDMAVFMTGMLCPQPCSQSATPPSSFKSIVSHGVSAFIDETFDL